MSSSSVPPLGSLHSSHYDLSWKRQQRGLKLIQAALAMSQNLSSSPENKKDVTSFVTIN
jgi:hypothetical protein